MDSIFIHFSVELDVLDDVFNNDVTNNFEGKE